MRIRRIRHKLILAGFAALTPLIILTVFTLMTLHRQNRNQAVSTQRIIARRTVMACACYVKNILAFERCVAASWDRSESDTVSYPTKIVQSSGCIRHIAFLYPNGKVFASDIHLLIGKDLSNLPAVRNILQGSGWAASDGFHFDPLRQHVFAVVCRVADEQGRFRGVIVSFVDRKSIQQATKHDILEATHVVVLDRQCRPVFQRGFAPADPQPDWARLKLIQDAIAGKTSCTSELTMPNGVTMIAVADPVPDVGWVAVALAPLEDIMRPVHAHEMQSSLVMLITFGITLSLGLYLGNHITRPILGIAETARKYAAGDSLARAEVKTNDEVQVLATTFNEMASALEQLTNELRSALENTRRQAEKASTFNVVAQGLVVTNSVHGRLEIIAHALTLLCKAKRSVILLSKGDRLVGLAGWGLMRPTEIAKFSVPVPMASQELAESLEQGKPFLVRDASKSTYLDQSLVSEYDIKGYLLVPLIRRQHLIGVVFLDTPGEYPDFDPETIETARELASLASIAIENAESFEKWASVATALQRGILPRSPERIGRFAFGCGYHPAVGMAEVGGDFYDFVSLDERNVGLVIADVSGKGLEAAVHTVMGKYVLRAFVSEDFTPGQAIGRANRAIIRSHTLWGFITLF
ncbi:MAG: GAF domain-containing protein, partial [Armatimonadota bacterium]